MPKRRYRLESGGPKRLEVSWRGGWEDFNVKLDGIQLGRPITPLELDVGYKFPLPDGSVLFVQSEEAGLALYYNGRLLRGSTGGPAAKRAVSYNLILFIGGLTTLTGLVGEIFRVGFLQGLIGRWGIVAGIVFLALGYLVKRRSKIALALAIGLWTIELLIRLVNVLAGGIVYIGAFLIGIMILVAMAGGFEAIDDLREEEAKTSSDSGIKRTSD